MAAACLAVSAAPACRVDEPTRDILAAERKLYSQYDEELIIRDFFQDRRDGFFLEVGCFEYERYSATCCLQKHLGWSGIGVDANDSFRAGREAHRPRTQFDNHLVSDESGSEENFYLLVGGEGISSISRQWILGLLERLRAARLGGSHRYFPHAKPNSVRFPRNRGIQGGPRGIPVVEFPPAAVRIRHAAGKRGSRMRVESCSEGYRPKLRYQNAGSTARWAAKSPAFHLLPRHRVFCATVSLACTCLAPVISGCAAGPEAPGPEAPNVVLITLDGLRRDHVSWFGYPRATTPNIDWLASRGLALSNTVATSC